MIVKLINMYTPILDFFNVLINLGIQIRKGENVLEWIFAVFYYPMSSPKQSTFISGLQTNKADGWPVQVCRPYKL